MNENEFNQIKNELVGLAELIQNDLGWDEDKTIVWMDTQNPFLGGLSPIEMAAKGKINKVKQYVLSCLTERNHDF